MCKVRCWRWLFGNEIPISVARQALAGFLGTEAYKTTPTAFVTSDEMKKVKQFPDPER